MNPLNNDYFGQVQHREYEAKYGQPARTADSPESRPSFVSRHKVAVALSGAATVIIAIINLGI